MTDGDPSDLKEERVIFQDGQGSLYHLGSAELTEESIEEAKIEPHPTGYLVEVDLSKPGAKLWAQATSAAACDRDEGKNDELAMVVRKRVVSSPGMDPGVKCGTGIGAGVLVIPLDNRATAKRVEQQLDVDRL